MSRLSIKDHDGDMAQRVAGERGCQNTDRELWRETEGDFYAPYVFVTEHGGIGLSAGGATWVMTIPEWVKCAGQLPKPDPANSGEAELKPLRYVYRLRRQGEVRVYEIGECDNPRSYDGWCDRRVCEGFWGDEESCKHVVDLLNRRACPDCAELDAKCWRLKADVAQAEAECAKLREYVKTHSPCDNGAYGCEKGKADNCGMSDGCLAYQEWRQALKKGGE